RARGTPVKLVGPVDDLAVAVIEPSPPFACGFRPLLLEDAAGSRVLELDEAVGPSRRLPDRQVTREVAEDVELPADVVRPGDPGIEHPEEDRHLWMGTEKGLHVVPLGQLVLVCQPHPELLNLLAAERVVEGDGFELLHPTWLPAPYRSRNRRRVSSG